MAYFIGMEVQQCEDGVFIHQKKFADDLLIKFCMENCKPVYTPFVIGEKLISNDGIAQVNGSVYMSLIGSLLYLCATRPDIVFSVNYLSRFMQTPTENHLKGAKRVLRYIKGTTDYGIFYGRAELVKFLGFSDSDWAGSDEQMKSLSGNCFTVGTGLITWSLKKQGPVAQSTAEAEYIGVSEAVKQAIWLRKLMKELVLDISEATVILCDNCAAISIAKNPMLHSRTKHIKVKYHAVRYYEEKKEVKMVY
ncbi:secreted RxLR effector protein 161-like [Dioscorea cayenensis subsp. rotundata]|uniref:Secreted RxLR effector protein 161-like n=1 Tax=Dioscorea cayennensis subsp. rotundata TaxID=55577 RepID=A0AB40BY35_DIOCR|nr:secreted RxLR effector protein 161-like [Dioscorea cayenensis subsp. rotundata]